VPILLATFFRGKILLLRLQFQPLHLVAFLQHIATEAPFPVISQTYTDWQIDPLCGDPSCLIIRVHRLHILLYFIIIMFIMPESVLFNRFRCGGYQKDYLEDYFFMNRGCLYHFY
jgi:hypothetical protein